MTGSLRPALDPGSIAIIGASENTNKIGGRPLFYLRKSGYAGRVFPVNPARREVQGHVSYPGLDALPEVPEMAIVVVPGAAAEQAVEQCASLGVKLAIVMSSGFGESDPVGGKEAERRMVAAARKGGMRIVGPNSQGLANFGTGAIASFSTMFLEAEPKDGPVAILSQSGAMSVVPYGLLRQRGIGVRHCHATGNDCDVTVAELTTAVAADPQIRLLLLYLEGMPDPHHLAQAAAIARERDLPVIALKAGRTPAGQDAARSHTGALANEDRIVDAFFAHHGIWRAQNLDGLVEAAELYLKGWRPTGRRLVSISNSGAVCVLSADAASNADMPLANLAPETRAGLQDILPSFATTTNPVDITAALLTNSKLFGAILPIIARDPAADAFFIGIPVAGAGYDVPAFARDAAHFAQETGKPIVVAAPQPSVAAHFAAEGLPTFVSESQAICALNQFTSHYELMKRTKAAGPRSSHHPWPADDRTEQPTVLNEAESLAIAAQAGLGVVAHRVCRSAEECVAAWRALDGPVAIKGCSRDAPHKSELGLVRLGVNSEPAVAAAWRAIVEAMRERSLRFDGVIVAAMVHGRRELMIGTHRDPVFGPIVAVGGGGKYVEALGDVRILIPPFGADEVERALRTLHIAPLLQGVRGEPPLDVPAFCDAAVKVGRLMLDDAQGVLSLDLNPVMVGARGEGCLVADALALCNAGAVSSTERKTSQR
jgi:acetate---CoA ligase (ADP-forming)